MIPEGKYTARATGPQDAEFGEKDGRSFIFVRYQFKGGEQDGKSKGHFFWFGSEAQSAFGVAALRASGCTFENGYDDLTGLGSKDVTLVIEHEEKNGKTYDNIKYVNAIGGVRDDQKMAPAQKSSFAKNLTAMLGPANPNAKKKTEAPPIDEADIPF